MNTRTLPALQSSIADGARDFSLVVYGGVPCGIAAAVAAAREGAKVVLIETTKHVGGLSTSGINTAESEHMLPWTIGGFADAFYRRLGAHYGTGAAKYFFESSVAEKVYLDLLREAGVEVRYGASVDTVSTSGTRIMGITLTNGARLQAKVFLDASYEGDLMARAGVGYAVGRESKAQFGEEAAGIRFDKTPRKARTTDVQGKLLPGISFVNEGRIWRLGYAYQIPYRALTPKATECTNLLVPGAASYTHVAFCTLRLESVWMITGQAAGVAAAMAATQNGDVQKVALPELQSKLRAQNQVIDFIPGQPQKCEHLNGPPEF